MILAMERNMIRERRALVRESKREGKKEGIKEGKKAGITESKKEIAQKLLKINMPIEQIIEVTELDRKEIEKFK